MVTGTNDQADKAMTAARAFVAASGQTPDGTEIVINGEEAVRTIRFHPDLARITKNTTEKPNRVDVTPSSLLTTAQADIAALAARVAALEAIVLGRIVRTNTGLQFIDSESAVLFQYGITDGNAKGIGFFGIGIMPRPGVSESSPTLDVDLATALNSNGSILKGA